MKEFTYTIVDKDGMHARPAGKLVARAKQFDSAVTVKANGKKADAKRLLSLMMLGAVYGTILTFSIEGEDEEKAARELEAFCCTQWTSAGGDLQDEFIQN